jgi:hypothetical protein
MLPGENRRTFLSALLLAGGSAAAFAESYRQGDVTSPEGGADPLFVYIQQQLSTTLRTANSRGGLTAEDVVTAASSMRVCAAHARGLNLDAVAREALVRRLASTSREGFIAATPDLASAQQRLRRRGLMLSDRLRREVTLAGRDARAAALEAIRDGRSSVICDRLAEALEVAAPRLAERRGPVRRVAAADEWWCNFYLGQWSMHLALAWSLAALEEQSLQDFIDAVWAGFVFYEGLYTSQC